jgi:hypothetical protein
VLSGKVTGATAGAYDNVGVAGARLRIFATDRETGKRLGDRPVYATTTGASGAWGPFRADPETQYEFVVAAAGFPVTRIYRSPFPRSSSVITLRPALAADASATEATVVLARPRGYLGRDDTVLVDGERPAGIPDDPVPSVDRVTLRLPPTPRRAVRTRFEGSGSPSASRPRARWRSPSSTTDPAAPLASVPPRGRAPAAPGPAQE